MASVSGSVFSLAAVPGGVRAVSGSLCPALPGWRAESAARNLGHPTVAAGYSLSEIALARLGFPIAQHLRQLLGQGLQRERLLQVLKGPIYLYLVGQCLFAVT